MADSHETMTDAQLEVISAIMDERDRQDAKWGEQNHEDLTWTAVLGEEFGEACQAALHDTFGGSHAGTLREELIHVAAVAVQWIECIDRQATESEPTESEPTLHERLRKAECRDTSGSLNTYQDITEKQLAAIQKQIEDAATATLRAEVDHWKLAAEGYRERLVGQVRKYNALKARADALRDLALLVCDNNKGYPNQSHKKALRDAITAYDAADRAGETEEKK